MGDLAHCVRIEIHVSGQNSLILRSLFSLEARFIPSQARCCLWQLSTFHYGCLRLFWPRFYSA